MATLPLKSRVIYCLYNTYNALKRFFELDTFA